MSEKKSAPVHRSVHTASGRISYTEQGTGPVALFVHGVLLNGYLWRHQLEDLSDVRRCIALDLLAHGDTEIARNQDVSVTANAKMIKEFLDALHIDDWATILQKLVSREGPRSFRVHEGFAVGVVLTVPPFPYAQATVPAAGQPVFLRDVDEFHLHYGELKLSNGRLVTSGPTGYALVVTGRGETVPEAQKAAYALARKVFIPNVRYRIDIGNDLPLAELQGLGWL